MFTGIVESLGKITEIESEGNNLHFTLQCPFANELKIDQSLAHDGVCLTVVEVRFIIIYCNCHTGDFG